MHLLLRTSLLLLTLTISFRFELVAAFNNRTDLSSLVDFKNQITSDPSGALSSWNESLGFCQWEGVLCSKRHPRVTALNLHGRRLVGTLSPTIGNLTFLRVVNLGSNSFRGIIPPQIGNLFRLEVLNLSYNSFTGEIPADLSHCTNLKLLNLNNNGFFGHLPMQFGFNINLQILLVASNNLTGPIPPSLGNLSSLSYLVLMINSFEGGIPYEIGRLKNLKYLQLAGNLLSSELPPSVYNLSSLTLLSVAGNQLHGTIPSDVGSSFPNLQWHSLGGNLFTGEIPDSLSNASNLLLLDFSQNTFSGTVPSSLGRLERFQWLNVGQNLLGSYGNNDLSFIDSLTNCSDLQILALSYNKFGGVLPNSISNLSTRLWTLLIGGNQVHGSIPAGIGNLVKLSRLALKSNTISGVIPSSIANLQSMVEFDFSGNRISGQIPSSLGNMSFLTTLRLEGNTLEGSIPHSLGNLQRLQVLDLSYNNLAGSIPLSILNLTYLSISLNLARNYLTGSLPSDVGKLINLGELDVSGNKLSGEIPGTLGNCLNLEQLYMERNSFYGNIPRSLIALKGLRVLDLSRNNLTGRIPSYFEDLPRLQRLNLSFNNLDGEVPTGGVFANSSAVSLEGNVGLCGGIRGLELRPCPLPFDKRRHMKVMIILVVVGVGCCSLILTLSIILCLKRRSRVKLDPVSLSDEEVRSLSYMKLFRATQGFSDSNLVGRGYYGSVFRGTLEDEGGKVVAVKVFNIHNHRSAKSFTTECDVLRRIRHRNLVKIVTACSNVDFKALVLEFMDNGNLDEWLHVDGEHEKRLNFAQRLNVAADVAFALEYLHFDAPTPVIHHDIKPSNILLDTDMTAHVGDFGLARLLNLPAAGHSWTSQSSSSFIRGTIGYVAPEYAMGSEPSSHGDVYSYGILLLEMFTGRRPIDEMFENDGLTICEFVKNAMASGRLLTVVDPSLLREKDTKEEAHGDEIDMECLVLVMELGLSCSKEMPRERGNMRNAARVIQEIRDRYLGSSISRREPKECTSSSTPRR